jgi:membrane-bound ClpP family serine protease
MGLKRWLGSTVLQILGYLLVAGGLLFIFATLNEMGFIIGIVITIFGLVLLTTGDKAKKKKEEVKDE